MKNFKFLSALALTGMLSAGIVGASLASETKPIGVFKAGTLVDDTTVVPFVLENKNDKITVDAIKKAYPTATDIKGDTEGVVGTGTTFKVGNETYTAVVYGDVNGDGKVTTQDATQVQIESTTKNKLNAVQKEAGDVKRAGELRGISTIDAVNIQRFAVGSSNVDIDEPPVAPEEAKYEFTVNDGIINDTNSQSTDINIKTADGSRVEESTTFTLYYVNDKGEEIKMEPATGLNIAQYANESGKITANFSTIMDNLVAANKEKDVKLILKTGTPEENVGTATINVNRIHPEAVKVNARREGTEGAGLKFEAKSGSDITKVYYRVNTANRVTDAKEFIKLDDVKSMDVSDNKFDSALENITALKNNTKYNVYFVVENKAGNLSVLYSPVIPKDSTAKQESKVTDVKVPDDLKPTWTEPTSVPAGGYKITVYNEAGEVIGEIDNATSGNSSLTDVIKEAGKYKITVTSNGAANGNTVASDETEPVEFEVSQLAKVENLRFVVDEEDATKVTLKWDEYSDKSNAAFDGYTIKIYEYDPQTGDYKTTEVASSATVGKDKTEISVTDVEGFSADPNTRYKAVISANASTSQAKVLPSETTETSKDYFNLSVSMTPTIKSDTEAELDITKTNKQKIEALGDEVTYDVEVWSEVESATAEKHFELTDTKRNVTVDENGKIVVDRLQPGTNYKFALVVHVDGDEAEGRSALSAQLTMLKTLPAIEGLVVDNAATKKEDTVGKIYSNGSTVLWINGEEVLDKDKAKFYDPNKLLDARYLEALVKSLNNGDTIVSVTDEKVSIKAASVATAGKGRAIKAGSTRVLEIEGNNNEQEIAVTDAKEVVLTGKGGLFKIAATNTAPVKLTDGVKVTNKAGVPASVTILANATATINEVDVKSSGDLELTVTDQELKVKAAKNNTIDIDNHSGKPMDVTFMEGAEIGDFQLGKITVNSNANVKIRADLGSKVEADLKVTTENGSIDVKDNNGGLTGAKEIVVSTNKEATADTVITAYAKLDAPIGMGYTNPEIEIRNYTVEQLKALRDKGTEIEGSHLTQAMLAGSTTDEDLKAIVDYFNAFGSKLQAFGKATIKVPKGGKNIEIKIPKGEEISLADIQGLK